MFSGALTIAAIVRCRSVVGPRSMTLTRWIVRATSKYFFDGIGRRELAVGAHPESEMGFRRGHLCGEGRCDEELREQSGADRGGEDAPHGSVMISNARPRH